MAEVIKQRDTKTAKENEHGKVLRLLLQVASGWLYFGNEEPAHIILDSARTALFEATLPSVEQTALACAYAGALGQARLDLALPRTLELYRKLSAVHDAFTTNSHYSLSRLDVVEATILALVNDDFKIAPEAPALAGRRRVPGPPPHSSHCPRGDGQGGFVGKHDDATDRAINR